MNIKRNFRNHFFFYTLIILIFISGVFSYCRFIINQDYIVGYEGACNPAINKCFEGCKDDACTSVYHYSKMVKNSSDLYDECGEDITDCEYANLCLPSDRDCSIIYCNPETKDDTCSVEVKAQNNNDDTMEQSSQNNE